MTSTMTSTMTTSPRPVQPIKLYRHAISGHAHRVQLFLSLLGLPCELIDVDLLAGAHKTPDFLALNSFGQVPVIQDGEVTLADSNAILVYLASRYAQPGQWLPTDPVGLAQVQRWLSVAAGQLAFGPSAARVIALFKLPTDPADARARAVALFKLMDAHLEKTSWLAGNSPTIADIAHYSYTAHAPEGSVDLQPYPHIRTWLARVEALHGFVPMVRTPIGLAA